MPAADRRFRHLLVAGLSCALAATAPDGSGQDAGAGTRATTLVANPAPGAASGSAPFDDASVRKAVSMALDRPRIMREALHGYAPPADATGLAESQSPWKDPASTGVATGRAEAAGE